MRKLSGKLVWSIIIAFVLSLLFGTPLSAERQLGFKDVKETDIHHEAIILLSEQEIINGYEDGTFGQWDSLSRQHAAVFLYRILNQRTITTINDAEDILAKYTDINHDHLYANEIAAVTYADIFSGSDGKFMPEQSLTREQMASAITNAFDLKEKDVVEHVSIQLDNVSPTHRDSVQILADLGLTKQLEDFRPAEDATRGAFATMLYRVIEYLE